MNPYKKNKIDYKNLISGILLILAAKHLVKPEIYTSVKKLVVFAGGSIALSIAIAMALIVLTFSSGIFLIRSF